MTCRRTAFHLGDSYAEHRFDLGDVKRTEAHYLLKSNPGCLLQMKLGIEREGMSGRMKAMHIVDFLAERIK